MDRDLGKIGQRHVAYSTRLLRLARCRVACGTTRVQKQGQWPPMMRKEEGKQGFVVTQETQRFLIIWRRSRRVDVRSCIQGYHPTRAAGAGAHLQKWPG